MIVDGYPIVGGFLSQHVRHPPGRVLAVGQDPRDHLNPFVYMEVDETKGEVETSIFHAVGSGDPVPDQGEAEYLGTAKCGLLVWHVYRSR